MPRARQQNPLYTSSYNDPRLGAAAQNIGALLLGGESPNDAADRQAKDALMAQQGQSAAASAHEAEVKANIAELLLNDTRDPEGASARAASAHQRITDPDQRAMYDTYRQRRISEHPLDIGKSEAYNHDYAEMLRVPSQAGEVGTRQAALEGKPLYGEGGEGQVLQHFKGDIGQTPVSRANTAKAGAEMRKADAEALVAPTKGHKPPKDMQPTGATDDNGNPVYEMIPGSPTERKMSADKQHDAKVLQAANSAFDNIIRNIDLLTTGNDPRYKDVAGVTGPLMEKLPNTRAKGTGKLMGTLGATQVLGVIQNLKAQSASGQTGIGRVLQSEIPLFRDSVAPIASGLTEGDTLQNLQTLRAAAQASKDRINSGFESEYSGAGAAPAAAPASGAVVKWGRDANGNPVRQ